MAFYLRRLCVQLVGLGDKERPYALTHAPISVVPVPFPRDSFEKARAAMQVFNKLIDRVSRDGEYLQHTLQPAAEFDDFTARASPSHAVDGDAFASCFHMQHLYTGWLPQKNQLGEVACAGKAAGGLQSHTRSQESSPTGRTCPSHQPF